MTFDSWKNELEKRANERFNEYENADVKAERLRVTAPRSFDEYAWRPEIPLLPPTLKAITAPYMVYEENIGGLQIVKWSNLA